MASKLIYLGYYNVRHDENKRSVSLAGVNKMSYIIDCLKRLAIPSVVLSPINPIGMTGYVEEFCTALDNGMPIKFLPSFAGNGFVARLVRKFVFNFGLLKSLLSVSNDTVVIAYHSLGYAKVLRLAKRIKKFRLILEVEELYQDINEHSNEKSVEDKIIAEADAYILSSRSLKKRIGGDGKVAIVSSGNYKTNKRVAEQLNDGYVHIVYAGTFEAQKGGVIQAINSAKYLGANYRIHILGFGSENEVSKVQNLIADINKYSKCKVVFEGKLTGEPFMQFLQGCHIGLSTQNPEGEYNDTSFPSKILTYLSNGMKVVSVDIPVVREAAFGDLITLYQGTNGKNIADAIELAARTDSISVQKFLDNLDSEFLKSLEKIL